MTDDLTEGVAPAIDTDEEVEVIATEIEQTRDEMTGTVQAIGDRLDPANIVQDAKKTVREATVGRVEQMTSNALETAGDTGSGILEDDSPEPAACGNGGNRYRHAGDEPKHRSLAYRARSLLGWRLAGAARTITGRATAAGSGRDRAGRRYPGPGESKGESCGERRSLDRRKASRSGRYHGPGDRLERSARRRGKPARSGCCGLRGRRCDRDGTCRNGCRAQCARPGSRPGDRYRRRRRPQKAVRKLEPSNA